MSTSGSLLPGRILPPSVPWGQVQPDGSVVIAHDWWLLIYNLCAQVLGSSSGAFPADAVEDLLNAALTAGGSDTAALQQSLANLAMPGVPPDPAASPQGLENALIWPQTRVLADPVPLAQPVVAITPGSSPYAYEALQAGSVVVVGGTVSAIAVSRQGTSTGTGLTAGIFPVSRFDTLTVTYSGVPTMTFIPGSPQ